LESEVERQKARYKEVEKEAARYQVELTKTKADLASSQALAQTGNAAIAELQRYKAQISEEQKDL
jgi:hypothetical protein